MLCTARWAMSLEIGQNLDSYIEIKYSPVFLVKNVYFKPNLMWKPSTRGAWVA